MFFKKNKEKRGKLNEENKPAVTEENLAEQDIISFLPVAPDEPVDKASFHVFPLEKINTLGVAFQPMVSAVTYFFGGKGGSGLYYANTHGGSMFKKKGTNYYITSMSSETGGVGGGQADLMQLPFDPTMACMAMALMNIEKKLDDIQQMQQEMMDFLKDQERAKIRGNINTLVDVITNYKFNWDNEKYKTNKHILVQDIKRDAEQSLQLYGEQINREMEEKNPVHNDHEIKVRLRKITDLFKDFQLAQYQFAFASFLEVMLLENFDKDYLDSVEKRIGDLSMQYRELYTNCYNQIEGMAKNSLESILTEGFAFFSKNAGKAIAKVPVINKAPVDKALILAGDKVGQWTEEKNDKMMQELIAASENCTAPFVQSIEDLQQIYNRPMKLLFDRDNFYLESTDTA